MKFYYKMSWILWAHIKLKINIVKEVQNLENVLRIQKNCIQDVLNEIAKVLIKYFWKYTLISQKFQFKIF